MKVRDLMREDVVSVEPQTTLKEVATLLVEYGISGMPVCDENAHVVGVVSEGDVIQKERGPSGRRGGPLTWLFDPGWYADAAKAGARTAGEAMTSPALTIEPGSSVSAAARLMADRGVNRLPVVSRDGRLLGIVTRADLVRAFARPDREIAGEIREDVLRRVLWADPDSFEVAVRGGEVELAGELESSTDVVVLEELVGKIPGVVSVHSTVTHRIEDPRRAGRFAGYR